MWMDIIKCKSKSWKPQKASQNSVIKLGFCRAHKKSIETFVFMFDLSEKYKRYIKEFNQNFFNVF